MKTTLNLDDRLVRQAKKLAAERGVTLTSIVEEALRGVLVEPSRPRPYRFRMRTVKGTRPPEVDIADRDALYDWMEGRR